MKYDLHSHSTASDGTLSPAGLVQLADQKGIDQLSLTDHDTVAGLPEAHSAAAQTGVNLINGIELSTQWEGVTLHVVGLHIDANSPVLLQGVAQHQDFRDWRGREIARRLEQKARIENAYEGAIDFVKGGLISRSHFARYLVKAGHARDFREAIHKFLIRGKPGFVGGEWAALDEVVGWIRAAGGIAVIAHPARYRMTRTRLKSLLQDFVEAGGEGLEVVSGSHSRDDVRNMAALAREYGLLASAGSDFHDPDSAWTDLGRLAEIPSACKTIWDSDIWHERKAA